MSEAISEGAKLAGVAVTGVAAVVVTYLQTRKQVRKQARLPERRGDYNAEVAQNAARIARQAVLEAAEVARLAVVEAARVTVEQAAASSVAKAFELHLGTTNGEIKEDMATIKEYIRNHPILCSEKHLRVDSQIGDVRSIALAADQKAQQALLKVNQ